ncbi:hypothetical protein AC579_9010 [Pseudocercospora musae]|uniref:DUF7924 domain-containing protein n=1 Tax=Pseudocercospora musae TaxID=113226 RepID=A0A139GSZ2_9PEZI|nr:hypothetical protein AC579_9010 [Pseudocercospora musae]
MASSQSDTQQPMLLPQHAGVKRTRTTERQLPRESARLEELHQRKPALATGRRKSNRYELNSGARKEKCKQHNQTPSSRKRPRTQFDTATSEELSDERRKQLRGSAEVNIFAPAPPGNLCEDDQHPVAYWAANKRWPRQYFEPGKDMENILARKRSISARSRKNSDTGSTTPSSTDQGEPKSREQKSAEYRKPQYATVLATKGVFMEESELDISRESQRECKRLLERRGGIPEHSLFRDDLFKATCKKMQDKNEARVIQDISRLIVPSAETLTTYGATALKCLIESVNEGWNTSIPITKTRPQPDYAVGFRREAFTQDQLDRMHPIIGDFGDQSYFMATWYMYFPFLTCEVKCGAAALDIADRQNAHSVAIAVRAVVELFRAVKREKELHREILAFSISHDHATVRIYGYYAEVDGSETKYYRHTIRKFDFTELDGKEKWTAYQFTKNMYDNWMPMHFERICSAIDQIPADISFSVSQSEPPYPEQSSGLSQDFSAQSIAHSSAGSVSAQGQDDSQPSSIHDPVVTPSTSVTDRGFKRPKRDTAWAGRK